MSQLADHREEGLEGHDHLLARSAAADGDGPLLGLTLAGDQHVGRLCPLRLLDLLVHVAGVEHRVDPEELRLEALGDALGVVGVLLTDRDDSDLAGRDPEGELASEVLDESPRRSARGSRGSPGAP